MEVHVKLNWMEANESWNMVNFAWGMEWLYFFPLQKFIIHKTQILPYNLIMFLMLGQLNLRSHKEILQHFPLEVIILFSFFYYQYQRQQKHCQRQQKQWWQVKKLHVVLLVLCCCNSDDKWGSYMLLSSYCVVAIIVPFTGNHVHANEEEEEQALPPLPSPTPCSFFGSPRKAKL